MPTNQENLNISLVNYRYFFSGGPERYMFNILDLLEKNKHTVVPFSIKHPLNHSSPYSEFFLSPLSKNESSVYFSQLKKNPKTILKLISRIFYSFEAKNKVGKLIHKHNIDIAYILHFLRWISPSILDAFNQENIPIVVRASDYMYVCPEAHMLRDGKICELCLKGNHWHSVKYRCLQHSLPVSFINALSLSFHKLRNSLNKVDAFVCPSNFLLNKMIEGGFPKEKLHHIPTFIDTDNITPNFEPGKYILYFGRIAHEKGVSVLVDAFIKLKKNKNYGSLQLILAGRSNDQEVEVLKNQIKSNHITDIKILNEQKWEDLYPLIKHSAFVVVPSIWYDNMPNVILESFACGKPVIASELGSLTELVNDGETGLLFAPRNADDLAEKIAFLISDRSKIHKMGEEGYKKVKEQYSPQKHYNPLLNLFGSLIN